jgi:hypothetical protein
MYYREALQKLNLHLSHSLNLQQRVDTCKLLVEVDSLRTLQNDLTKNEQHNLKYRKEPKTIDYKCITDVQEIENYLKGAVEVTNGYKNVVKF